MIEIDLEPQELHAALPDRARRRLKRYDQLLKAEAAPRGHIARSSAGTSWDLHVLDSLAGLPILDRFLGGLDAPRVADVGSGAGLPGIPLAIARPRWQVGLLEERRSRVELLQRFAEELTVQNAQPLKVDVAGISGEYDAAAARAFAPPRQALAAARRLVHGRGVAVLYLTCDQLTAWLNEDAPDPLGMARYRLAGLRSGRAVAVFDAGCRNDRAGSP